MTSRQEDRDRINNKPSRRGKNFDHSLAAAPS